MHYVVVIKASYNMYNSVNLADMRQKLITEALTLGGTFYKTRYIDKFDYRGSYFFRRIHFGKLVKPVIGHSHNAYVRLNSAERIVCNLGACIGYSIKKRTLAYVRQTYDTKFHYEFTSFIYKIPILLRTPYRGRRK